MTTNKDFKRIVRSRMAKTGESYTAARARLLTPPASSRPASRRRATPAFLPDNYEKLAGLTDKTIKEKTGCTWERWVKALDHHKASEWDHNRIATFIHEKYRIDGWWAQMTAVGYERLKGLRARGQRRSGTWGADKSKTFNVPIAEVFHAFKDARTRKKWLPIDVIIRTSQVNKSMRLGFPDGTIAAIGFSAKGDKTVVAVGQDNLPSKAASDDKKAFWAARFGELAKLLA